MNKTISTKGTILVIGNTANDLNHLDNILTAAGFKVILVPNGDKGIKIALSVHPDLILLEAMMSEADCFAICQQLKSEEESQSIPIMLMTTPGETVNQTECFPLDIADYITQPFQPAEVLARVNTQINLRKLQQQLNQQNQQLQQERTKRQQLEEALTTAYEQFTLVLDNLEAVVYVSDLQTYRILFANAYVKKLLNNQELVGKVCWQALQKEQTGPCTFCTNNQLVSAEGQATGLCTWEFQNTFTKRWFYIQDIAIRWVDDRLVRLEVAIDITQRKQVEEALRESEERFELAMQATNEGLWDWNLETHAVYYSPRWKEMLGYTESELNSHADEFFKRLHPDDRLTTQETVTAYLEKKIPTYEVAVRMQHKNGYYVWILSRGLAVFNEQGKPIRMVGTHLDLTNQKQIEKALSQAKEAAEVANQAKSAFLANMSHELRTPLNSILGYTQLFIKNPNLTKQQQEGLAVIQRSGEYLLTLINDVLDLSKIETNRIELFPADFYFHGFLTGIRELFKMRAEQKNIVFYYQALTPLPMMIYADEKRLRQILINLLGNAVKFTEQGRVTFTVGLTQQHSNSKILFQVEDTGIGIAPDELDKLFLPFQQVGERNYQTQGTGLGLALSYKLVDMMGGQLQVKSQLGQGSTFWMVLDLPEVSKVKSELTHESVILGIDPPRTVLVVDDQLENRSLLVKLLAPLGFKMVEACNGQESVDKAQQQLPDVIFMDLVMPEMDGFEATRQIRKIPELQEVVIIAVSASIFDFKRQKNTAIYNDFVAKPFTREVLLEVLKKHLNFKFVYGDTVTPPHVKPKTEGLMKGPSPEQAAILFDFTLRGDIDSIIDYTEKLEQSDAELQAFTLEIKQLADNLKIKKIREIAKRYKEATPTDQLTTTPTAQQADILFDLAMKGDVYGLHDYIEQLEQSDDKLAPFLSKIRPLAQQFQYDKICHLVKPYTILSQANGE